MIKMDLKNSKMQLEGYFELLFREFYEVYIALKQENVFTNDFLISILNDKKALEILKKSGEQAYEDLQDDMNYFADLLTVAYVVKSGKELEDVPIEKLNARHTTIIKLMNGLDLEEE